MSDETYIPFSGIVDELRKLCDSKKTGTLFIATKANRSAQLMMDEGRILFVLFFNKRGRDGLKAMTQIKAGRFRFQESSVNVQPMDIPSTPEIIEFLEKAASGQVPDEPTHAPDALAGGGEAGQEAGSGLTGEQKRILEDILAVYIGPMAAIICEDHLDSATDIAGAIEALAEEIPSPDQAEKFRNEAAGKLR